MDVHVSLRDQQVTVEHLPEWVGGSGLAAAVRDAGYVARATGHDIYTGGDGAR